MQLHYITPFVLNSAGTIQVYKENEIPYAHLKLYYRSRFQKILSEIDRNFYNNVQIESALCRFNIQQRPLRETFWRKQYDVLYNDEWIGRIEGHATVTQAVLQLCYNDKTYIMKNPILGSSTVLKNEREEELAHFRRVRDGVRKIDYIQVFETNDLEKELVICVYYLFTLLFSRSIR
ncbi:hypothetical protein ACFOU0_09160 [Salinicoccus sesuvii]|uniref:Tubby C-terminal domain-containing protein n=1 Tax=Salinicoccus sesuvii TaxID=868281 RepID=A0ABV7N583_9STAP